MFYELTVLCCTSTVHTVLIEPSETGVRILLFPYFYALAVVSLRNITVSNLRRSLPSETLLRHYLLLLQKSKKARHTKDKNPHHNSSSEDFLSTFINNSSWNRIQHRVKMSLFRLTLLPFLLSLSAVQATTPDNVSSRLMIHVSCVKQNLEFDRVVVYEIWPIRA